MLEFSHQEFFETIIYVLRPLIEKTDNMHKEMDNVNPEMKIPRKNQKEMVDT